MQQEERCSITEKFVNDYPDIWNMIIHMNSEIEYLRSQIKEINERSRKEELSNIGIRKTVFDNLNAILYMSKYLKDIGAV